MSQQCAFHGEDCRGRLQWHHVVSRQRLRREWKSAKAAHRRGGPVPWQITHAIGDPRNLVALCCYHHGEVEAKRLYVALSDEHRAFASEYGLLAVLQADESRVGVRQGLGAA